MGKYFYAELNFANFRRLRNYYSGFCPPLHFELGSAGFESKENFLIYIFMLIVLQVCLSSFVRSNFLQTKLILLCYI